MKKILTASLVAIMAVTAANADIASTKYVNTQTGLPENQKTFGADDFAGVASGKTNLKDAVNAIAQELNANLGENGTVTEQIGGAVEDALGTLPGEATTVAGAIGELKNAAGTAYSSVADAISGEVGALASGAVKDNADAIEAINNSTTGIEAKAKKYTDDKILELDANTEVTGTNDGSYVTTVAQTDGKITVSTVEFDSSISDTNLNSTNAPSVAAVVSYVQSQTGNLGETIGDRLNDIDQSILDINNSTTGIEAKAKKYTDEEIQKLDANAEVTGTNDGSYVTAVAQADGKITVSTVAFDAALDANSTNAVQNKVVNTAITGIKTNLGGLDGKNIAAIPDACKEGSQGTCSLVMKNGQATWEVVEY